MIWKSEKIHGTGKSVSEPAPCDILSALSAKDRHDLRSAILTIRISADLLCDGDDLSEPQRKALIVEMRTAASYMEETLLSRRVTQVDWK